MIGSIVLIIVFTFLNAVFACAEIAVISMNETKLKHLVENGNKRAKKLAALTEQPSRFLATIQVAITLSGFLNSAFASDNFAGLIADALMKTGIPVPRSVLNSVAVLVVTIVLSYISIVFGELVPKRFAMKNSESLSLGLAPTLYGVAKLFSPLVSLLTVSTNLILKLFGMDPTEDDDQVTKEEIQMMLMEEMSRASLTPRKMSSSRMYLSSTIFPRMRSAPTGPMWWCWTRTTAWRSGRKASSKTATAIIRSIRTARRILWVSWIPRTTSAWKR